MIAYLTDVEGRWDKLASFAAGNVLVSLDGGRLQLADGATFVFGGDAIDRGPAGRRIVETLLAARRAYGERVVLLAGNRDINKLRLVRELTGAPPAGAVGKTRGELLRWIFANTMGAPKAFEFRAAELGTTDDERVVQSYLDDLAPGGPLRAYLAECRLGFRAGATLFLHGGVTADNFGIVPGGAPQATAEGWLRALNAFYAGEIAAFQAGREPAALIAYQRPLPGTHLNQTSVVYARPTDELGNPHLPDADAIARLRREGIGRLVVGHTPSGDCPAILRDGDFELVLADNSYAKVERGSQVAISDDLVRIHGETILDGGARSVVDFATARGEPSPLGARDRDTGELVKARLPAGFLMFRAFENHRTQQLAATDLAARSLEVPR